MAREAAASGSERQRAHDLFQAKMERREHVGWRKKGEGWPMQKVMVGLAVCTLALGLAMLAIVTKIDLNGVKDVPPHVALANEPGRDEIQVLQAEEGLRWSDLQLAGDCAPLLNGRPLHESPQAPVQAGDVLSCAAGETLEIHSTRARGDAVLYRYSFPPPGQGPSATLVGCRSTC